MDATMCSWYALAYCTAMVKAVGHYKVVHHTDI
jgi:hypothetical protein